MPSTAEPLVRGIIPRNLMIMSAYRLTPPVMNYLLSSVKDVKLEGIIAPGHVSAIIGANAWKFIPEKYGIPTIVTGFEPIDVLISILLILKQLLIKKPKLINEYKRVVKAEGNTYAKKVINEAYEVVNAYWRGIGVIPLSGVILKDKFKLYDAMRELSIDPSKRYINDLIPGCRCGDVVLGRAKPIDCPLFLKACTPERPFGPCMVSIEGTCRIWAENLVVYEKALRQR